MGTTPTSSSSTQVIYTTADTSITVTGVGLDFTANPPTARDIRSIQVDFTGPSGGFLLFDQIDFSLEDLLIAAQRDQTSDPAALERFLGSLDWTIMANDTADDWWVDAISADGTPLRLNGDDNVDLGGGVNRFFAANGDDTVRGGAQNDTLHGGQGDDALLGGPGEDFLIGSAGDDRLFGGTGDDRLIGGADDDLLNGNAGDDVLVGGEGTDTLAGSTGNDTLAGNDGNDVLAGQEGNDRLNGGRGNDLLSGGADDDLIIGGTGNDTMFGGTGSDRLVGGAGADLFVFAAGDGAGRAVDFVAGEDRILLSGVSTATDTIDFTYFGWGVRIDLDNGSSFQILGVTQTGPDAFTGFDETGAGVFLF